MTETVVNAPSLTPRDPVPEDCDVAIVGGGILGLAVARELALRQPDLHVAVLEAEERLAAHQTGHNSGVIHAGIYYPPGSLKATLCVEGRRRMYEFCADHGIAAERCGKLIVATTADEVPGLRELQRRGQENGVPGLRWLGGEHIADIEPHAVGVAALHSPDTGIVDYTAVSVALADDVRRAGHTITTGCRVTHLASARPGAVVHHAQGSTRARHVVACAGAWSDRLATASGAPDEPRIVPFRGAYQLIRPERSHLVRGLIYPVPDPTLPFLGVHLTRHVDGSVSIGPTALMVGARDAYRVTKLRGPDLWDTIRWPGSWKLAWRYRHTACTQLRDALLPSAVVRAASQYVPELRAADAVPGPAGIRAQALDRSGQLVEDFVFYETEWCTQLRNAPSPAATSSLAIAARVAGRVLPHLGHPA
jgi:2-hydroxyglutarate dehydrogenase